jgi:hypothetical protein
MKLITETRQQDIQYITEGVDNGKKAYFIRGIFAESNVVNKNHRLYEAPILEAAVNSYNENFVKNSRALGELGHPEGPTVNLERVCHMIKDLHMEGNQVMGNAKIMDTPYGRIVQNLIDEGAKLGVSTRGMGSLAERNGVNVVQNDFMLAAVDVVADPSAPNAFVNGIMEGKEWVWDNGVFKPALIENYKKQIEKAGSRNLEEAKLKVFRDFLSKL